MRGSAALRMAVAPGGALAGPWVKNELWRRARAVPSLDLQFADSKSLTDAVSGQNLITFTRASGATFTDSQGVIRNAVTNLLLRSEEFSDAAWIKTAILPFGSGSTENATQAPNGTLTADLIVPDTNNTGHSLQFSGITASTTITSTLSFYVKAAGYSTLHLRFGEQSTADRVQAEINLTTATVSNVQNIGTATGGTVTLNQLADGWFRVVASVNPNDAGATQLRGLIYPNTSAAFAGDGTSGIYLWGAQLEQSSTVGEYIPTTSTINSAPRFDHNPTTGESLGLLPEEQRTNLLPNSNNFSVGFQHQRATRTANALASPDGTTTATLVVPTTESGSHASFVNTLTITPSASYAYSIFAKPFGYSHIQLSFTSGFNNANAWANFSLVGAGSIASQGTSQSASIQAFPGGWYRCTVIATAIAGAGAGPVAIALDSDRASRDPSFAGNDVDGIFLWGAQLEAGAFPTSYIPTTGTAATRSADVCSITGSAFSGWYRQDEGSLFVDGSTQKTDGAAGGFLTLNDSTGNNRVDIRQHRFDPIIAGAGSASVTWVAGDIPTITPNIFYRQSVGYSGSSHISVINGFPRTSTSVIGAIAANRLALFMRDGQTAPSGGTGGHIRRLTYWPQRLPNEVLQRITL